MSNDYGSKIHLIASKFFVDVDFLQCSVEFFVVVCEYSINRVTRIHYSTQTSRAKSSLKVKLSGLLESIDLLVFFSYSNFLATRIFELLEFSNYSNFRTTQIFRATRIFKLEFFELLEFSNSNFSSYSNFQTRIFRATRIFKLDFRTIFIAFIYILELSKFVIMLTINGFH